MKMNSNLFLMLSSLACIMLTFIQLSSADDDEEGLFFNSFPYKSEKKEEPEWKALGIPNPYLVDTPNAPSYQASANSKSSNNNQRNNQRSESRQQFSPSLGQQQNMQISQRNQMSSVQSSDSSSGQQNTKDVYLQSVNSRNQASQMTNNAGRQQNSQREHYQQKTQSETNNQNLRTNNQQIVQEDKRQSASSETLANVPANKGQRQHSPNQGQQSKSGNHRGEHSRNRHHPTQAATTTTTSTTAKPGEGMYFNSWPYNSEKKENKEEEEWKQNNEPNPFLFDNPNKPRQEPVAPPAQPYINYGAQEPLRFPNQPLGQEALPAIKTKWQYEEEEEEQRRKMAEKYHPPPMPQEAFGEENNAGFGERRPADVPPRRLHHRPFDRNAAAYHHQSYEVARREDMEKSGEVERVPHKYYEGKVKIKKQESKNSEENEIEEDPPTTIQRVKNWFVKSRSASSKMSTNTLNVILLFCFIYGTLFF